MVLVGGIPTPLKNMSQLGWWLFPIFGKIKHVPNHQPDNFVHWHGPIACPTSLQSTIATWVIGRLDTKKTLRQRPWLSSPDHGYIYTGGSWGPGGCIIQGNHVSTITGWWFQTLRKILVNWDDYSKYMGKSKMFRTTNQIITKFDFLRTHLDIFLVNLKIWCWDHGLCAAFLHHVCLMAPYL